MTTLVKPPFSSRMLDALRTTWKGVGEALTKSMSRVAASGFGGCIITCRALVDLQKFDEEANL
jgi:hypothetical protein